MSDTTGRSINDKILESGVCPLVDLAGDRIWFYPRGRLPRHVLAYLETGSRAKILRDFLVSVARGVA